MWKANGWVDYEVIDCSRGEKLERWGKYRLIRPDPQIIWDTEKKRRRLETSQRPLSPQQKGRRGVGIFQSAPAVEY